MRFPCAVVVGDHTQGLGIARSAAAAGARVWVVNDKYISLARFSRHVSGYKRLRPGTLRSLDRLEYVEHLKQTLLDLAFDGSGVLFGVNEDITRFIYEHRVPLQSRYLIPDARLDSIYDKFEFNKLAPETVRIDTRLLSEVDFSALNEPGRFLLKGRCGNAFRQITGQKAVCLAQFGLDDRARLLAKIEPDQVVLQEIVKTDRPVTSVCSFSINGQVKGVFGYEKLRQHPNCFGTGTYLRSAAVDELIPAAQAILARLHFTGISEIEFIHDKKGDTYRVIEMNPRAWKSVHFATQCGQNLVARHLLHLAGNEVDLNGDYAKNQYWSDLATDIPQMLRERRIRRYNGRFFECTWVHSDPLPALVLWTMFPLIAVESWVNSRIAKVPATPTTGGVPRSANVTRAASV